MDNTVKEETETVAYAPFVHLHNHTDYSLLDGAGSIRKYIAKCKEMNMKALAITDHGNMYGALKFYDACRDAGIKPIVGCEFYMNPKGRAEQSGSKNYHLILLAMNDHGYHNLMELNSIAFTEGFYYKPRIDDEALRSHSDDLICLSACLGGEILQNLLHGQYEAAKERALWFKGVFGDRYYLELQDHGLKEQKRTNPLLMRLSKELGIPLVVTNDIHYIEKDDADAHDILLCIGTASKRSDERRMRFETKEFYFKSADEMRALFPECPEAADNTLKICDRIDLEIHRPGPLLPKFQVPDEFKEQPDSRPELLRLIPTETLQKYKESYEENPEDYPIFLAQAVYLINLANEGLRKRYPHIDWDGEEIGEERKMLQERLDHELRTIIGMKFPGYFLIVRDYIHWAKTHGIPVGPGRGSGAGSLVAYSITITDVDPIKYSLLFERFLNPERVSLPDFDVDFDFEHREDVIRYVTERYGHDHVAQIATFGTLKAKAVVKDVARVLDIPFDESNRICKLIPDDPKMTLEKAFEEEPKLGEIEGRGGVYADLFDAARRLEGLNRHSSTHACGIVIGQEELIKYVPLAIDSKTKGVMTQYTSDILEDCGLVKMDFLGLKTLTLIRHTLDLIRKKEPGFDLGRISEQDARTFEMLCAGDSMCVFQFESPGMQKILRQAHPDSIEDLVALNALYRPGPMGFIPQYVDCKNGRRKIEYIDPALEPILRNTYGVIVYQEQVMQCVQVIAGYSLGEADVLRRIMGKKKVDKIKPEKEKFVRRAIERGHSERHAIEIFEMIEPFAGYGFNKSHAVAYSVLAYQTAYLKANYPVEFIAANLTNEMSNPDKFREYLALASERGIKVLPPDVNASDAQFNAVDGNIVYGLAGIKNVGEAVAREIIEEREKNGPYKSFMEFLSRQENCPNTKLLESLIKAGAFDSFGVNRATLMGNMEGALAYDKSSREATAYGQISLFGDDVSVGEYEMTPASEPWGKMDILEMEKEFLGFYVSGHPLDDYKEDIERVVWVDISKPDELPKGKGREVSLICQCVTLKEVRTKSGDKMCSFTLSNYQGSVDAVAFPKDYKAFEGVVEKDGIYGFDGYFDNGRDEGKVQFVIRRVHKDPHDMSGDDAIQSVNIEFSEERILDPLSEGDFNNLKDYIVAHSGRLRLRGFAGKERDESAEFGREFSLGYSKELKAELLEFPMIENVWYS